MGAFGGFFITNKGRALQAKAQAGVELHYNRIAIGDGSLVSGQQIADLTRMIGQKKTLPITKLDATAGGRAIVGTSYNNAEIMAGFYLREIGVFAQDPDEGEVLYCYANAGSNAEYISPGGGPDVLEKYINVETIVGNAASVTATIDSSLVFVSLLDFDSHKDADILDHPDGSVTDAKIGNRFIDDNVLAGNDGSKTLTEALSMLANMIKQITGQPGWSATPDKTLAQLATELSNAVKRSGGIMNGPLKVATTGRELIAGDYGDMSDNSSGVLLLANNAYTGDPDKYFYANTHATMGARGIRLRQSSGIEYFDTGSIATVAGAEFTPNWVGLYPSPNATANRVVLRDNVGRAKVAPPVANDDVATKGTVDTHASNNSHVPFAVATGTENVYAVTLSPAPSALIAGLALAVQINVTNTALSSLKVNGLSAKLIKKGNGLDVAAGTLKAGSIYTLRYNGTAFILQGEGGDYGTAVAADVLAGKTIGTDSGIVQGIIPVHDGVSDTAAFAYGKGTGDKLYTVPPAGYFNNGARVVTPIPWKDMTNGGAGGQARWHPYYELSSNNGQGIFVRACPADGSFAVAYAGDCWILVDDPDFNAGNWRADREIFGLQGAMPVRIGPVEAIGTAQWPDGALAVYLPQGFYPSSEQNSELHVATWQLQAADGDLQPWNILNSANIFGVQGSVNLGSMGAHGTATLNNGGFINIGGLAFKPRLVFWSTQASGYTMSGYCYNYNAGAYAIVVNAPTVPGGGRAESTFSTDFVSGIMNVHGSGCEFNTSYPLWPSGFPDTAFRNVSVQWYASP